MHRAKLLFVIAGLILVPTMAKAGIEATNSSAFYINGSFGNIYNTSDDANHYFVSSGGNYPQAFCRIAGLGLGYNFNNHFGLEGGVNGGPDRVYQADFIMGPKTITNITEWDASYIYLMPTLNFASYNNIFPDGLHSTMHTLGLKIGSSYMDGTTQISNNYGGIYAGGYKQGSVGNCAGIMYRYTEMFGDHFSVSIECGYDWLQFHNIQNSDGTGYFEIHPSTSPEQNADDSNLTVDASGVYLKFVLAGWFSSPVILMGAPKKQADPITGY